MEKERLRGIHHVERVDRRQGRQRPKNPQHRDHDESAGVGGRPDPDAARLAHGLRPGMALGRAGAAAGFCEPSPWAGFRWRVKQSAITSALMQSGGISAWTSVAVETACM